MTPGHVEQDVDPSGDDWDGGQLEQYVLPDSVLYVFDWQGVQEEYAPAGEK